MASRSLKLLKEAAKMPKITREVTLGLDVEEQVRFET